MFAFEWLVGGFNSGVLCISGVGVAYISDKVTSLWRILNDIMTMETIRRLDVNAVLLRVKSSKPSNENMQDERVYVYIPFKFILNYEYTKSLS